jgi:putative transposase
MAKKIRCDKGMEGLKDRPKAGTRPEISAEVGVEHRVDHFKGGQQRMDHQAGQEVNYAKDRGQIHPNHIYRIGRKYGFKQKVPMGVHVDTATRENNEDFKKRPMRYLWIRDTKRKVLP